MYKHICKLCGNEYDSKMPHGNVCNDCKNRPCEVCGKNFLRDWPYDQRTCSPECRHKLRTDPANIAQKEAKKKAHLMEKYGVDNVSKLPEVKKKLSEATIAATRDRKEANERRRQLEKEKKLAEKAEAKRQKELEKKRAKLRKCKLCGKLFMPVSSKNWYCNREHFAYCKVCGKQYALKRVDLGVERNVCYSSKCSAEWRKRRNIEIYGVPNSGNLPQFVEKRKQTNLEKYGVDNPFKCPEIKQKIKDSLLENWGEGMPELVKKRSETCLKRYGVSNPRKLPEIESRIQKTNLEKYGTRFPSTDKLLSPESHHKAALSKVSKLNLEWKDKLDSIGWITEVEFPLELKSYDLYMEGCRTLVEIDPTYTHYTDGEQVTSSLVPSSKTRQLEKSILAEKYGYHCVHIFDWDDKYKMLQLLRRDRQVVYARSCKVVEIDDETAREFESVYHLQGPVTGQLVCIGLDCNGELVQVMTFGRPRYTHKYQWELLRLCTHSDYSVVGGASKLFSYFIKSYSPSSVLSYCDRAKFSGQVYTKIGMKLDHVTEPSKVWSKGTKYITDNLLRQRGYDQLFGTNYGKGTSNEELMIQNGWRSIYDCGQFVYKWTK